MEGRFPFYPEGTLVPLLLPTGGFSESPILGDRGSSQGASGSWEANMVWREEVVYGRAVSDIDRPERQDSQSREIEDGPCPELRESS